MTQPAQYTAEKLEGIRRARNRAVRVAWIAGAMSLVVVAILILAGVDERVLLPLPVREAGVGLLAAILLLAAFQLWRLGCRPGDAKEVALELENRQPDLGCVVSTAAEYMEGKRTIDHPYEPELVEALQSAAAGKIRTVATPWYRGRMTAAAGLLLVSLAALALFVWRMPAGGVAVARVAWPWANVSYTHVEVRPGNTELAVGHSLNVVATFHGRLPKDASLRWRTAQANYWQTIPLSPAANGSCSNLMANLTNAIVYQVAGGGAVSPEYSVNTFTPPEIKSLTTRVEFPAYTKHPAMEQTTPDLRVVRGSHLAFHVAVAGDVASAKLCLSNQPPIELTRDANNRWTANLAKPVSADYRLELTDTKGRTGGNDTPYHLVVVPDEPPQVDIVDPQADVRANPTDKVPLRVTASDDFAVTGIKVVYHKLGQPEQLLTCLASNLDEASAGATAAIDLTPLHLQPYELVAYHAEARDNNTLDGPGTGKSPVYFIEFTTNSEVVPSSGGGGGGGGQKINLLELEKQIIAATTAVPEEKLREKLPDVASVQRQTQEYAQTFRDNSPILAAAPPEARTEFDAALKSMGGAIIALNMVQREPSLTSEEDALEHLYQAVKYFPELKPCMCNCTGIKIVAQAIEKKKQEDKQQQKKELPKLIAQAKKAAAAQAQLNGLYRRTAEEANPSLAKKEGQKPGSKPGSGNSGSSQDNPPPTDNPDAPEPPKADNPEDQQMAANPSAAQTRLAEQASEMAAKLRELAGNNPQISGRHAQHMSEVAENMRKAGKLAAGGSMQEADNTGSFAQSGIEDIIGSLEILANDQPHASESAAEEYPHEYGDKIADYLRALSYQQ